MMNNMNKILKALIVFTMLFLSVTSISADDIDLSELYEVKERGITVELNKKNEDGLILTGDEVNFNATFSVNYKQLLKEVYGATTEQEIYNVISSKIKEINHIMPKYKAIRGIILTQEPLIKTTTNKIKRQENLKFV